MNKLTVANLKRRINEILWVLLLTVLSSISGLHAFEQGDVPVKPVVNDPLLAEIDFQSETTGIGLIAGESKSDSKPNQVLTYGPIKRSDTLWSIAASVRPDRTVSMEQVMLSIVSANPDAFENSNLNVLKKGVLLTIPSKSQMLVVPKRRASSEVKKQHQVWDGIKTRVAVKKKPSARHKSTAKTKPDKVTPKVLAEVSSKQKELIAALKSDNYDLKEDLKRLSDEKSTTDKAYKEGQVTHEQLLATHEKLVKENESLSSKTSEADSKPSEQNNDISVIPDSSDILVNENSTLRTQVDKMDKEYALLKDELKARNSELSKVGKELTHYKKIGEESDVTSEKVVIINEWISTPAILYTILGVFLFLLLLPWLLLVLCKRAGKSGSMGVGLDNYESLTDLEEDSISESDLEHMLSDSDKVETKLDLARAYIDMGDIDGAKDILKQVMSEGDAQQQQEAEEIFGKM